MFVFKKSISSALILSTFLASTSAFAMNPGPGDDDQMPKVSAVAPKTVAAQPQEDPAPQAAPAKGFSTGTKVAAAVGVGALLWWGLSKLSQPSNNDADFDDESPSVPAYDMTSANADKQFEGSAVNELTVGAAGIVGLVGLAAVINRATGEENDRVLPVLVGGATAATLAAPAVVNALTEIEQRHPMRPSVSVVGAVLNLAEAATRKAAVVSKAALTVGAAGVVGAGAFALAAGTQGVVDGTIVEALAEGASNIHHNLMIEAQRVQALQDAAQASAQTLEAVGNNDEVSNNNNPIVDQVAEAPTAPSLVEVGGDDVNIHREPAKKSRMIYDSNLDMEFEIDE